MTSMEKIQDAINKYPINLDTIASIAEDFGKIAGKLSPSGAIAWIKDMAGREYCDWCEGGAFDLVYNLNNHDVRGEVDKESGIMSLWYGGKIVGSRRVNYCPMCGRPVGGRL